MDLGAKIRRGGKTDVSLLENYVSNLEFLLLTGKMTAAEAPFGGLGGGYSYSFLCYSEEMGPYVAFDLTACRYSLQVMP